MRILAAAVVLAAAAAPAAGVTLRLRPAEVGGAEVRLADVAEIGGVSAAEAEALGRVSLGSAPAAGRARTVSANYVRARVLAEGFRPEEVVVEGEAVEVRRAGRRLEPDRIRAAVEGAIAPLLPEGARIEIARLPEDVVLPPGEVGIEVSAPPTLRGRTSVPVVLTAGGATERVFVPVDVRRVGPVAVLVRSVPRGRVLTADDVAVEERDLTDERRDLVEGVGAAVGRRARRPMAAGTALAAADLEEVPLVAAGDRVTIRLRIGGVEVAATGVARAAGAIGAEIPVMNDATRRTIRARVVAPGEVEAVG